MRRNKALVILSSPRKGSNSSMAALFLANLIDPGFDAVDINRLSIRPCTACDRCADTFKCVYKDDAPALIKKMKKATVVIVAAPVYFTGVPAPMKAFIDRNQPEWQRRQCGTRNADCGMRSGVIILTQGARKPRYFKPAESEIRAMFAVNGIKTVKVLKFRGMDEKTAIIKDRKSMSVLESMFTRLVQLPQTKVCGYKI